MKASFMRSNESNIDTVEDTDGRVALLVKEAVNPDNPDWAQDPPMVLVGNNDDESIPIKRRIPSSPTIINQTIATADTWTQVTGLPTEQILEWHLRTRTRMVTVAYAFEDSPTNFMTIPPGWPCDRNTDISSTGLWVMVSRDASDVELEVWTV